MPLTTAQGCRLIQPTRIRPCNLILRRLSSLNQHLAPLIVRSLNRARQTQRAHLIESNRRRTLQRGTRRQASTQRHTRPQGRIKAAQRPIPSPIQRPRYTRQIRRPMVRHLTRRTLRTQRVQVQHVNRRTRLRRHETHHPIRARRQGNKRTMRQRNRQTRPPVIIHMLANNVDATRRTPHAPRLIVKRFTKQSRSLLGALLRGSSIDPHESGHQILLGLTHHKTT